MSDEWPQHASSPLPLRDLLLRNWRESAFPRGRHYLSKTDLSCLVTPATIRRELEQIGQEQSEVDSLTQIVQYSACEVFCILVLIGAVRDAEEFLRHGLQDADLPLMLSRTEEHVVATTVSGCIVLITGELRTDGLIENFMQAQWIFLSPKFRGLGEHHHFDENMVLPIIAEVGNKRVCHSSWVTTVLLDEDYLEPTITSMIPLAQTVSPSSHWPHVRPRKCVMKRLFSRRQFQAEQQMLTACNRRKHEHIIPLLASFIWIDVEAILLPQADADLLEFWSKTSIVGADNNESVVHWMLTQIHGLTSALLAIHTELQKDNHQTPGLHGDLKASNILLFTSSSTSHPPFGTLKLTDFSQSVLCPDPNSTTSFPPGSQIGTHQPPETLLHNPRSQSFDIWSLGCLLLEFTIWITCGPESLPQFDIDRRQLYHGYGIEFENDYFFELTSGEEEGVLDGPEIRGLNGAVLRWIEELRGKIRNKNVLRVLELVQGSLLRVEPSERISSRECLRVLEGILKDVPDVEGDV